MTYFGKNIKKIRGVKNLSQQAFADLFDLKRGTLGAYEEGRSEPKIETLLKITKHFQITLEDILTREMKVNELLQFKDDLLFQSKISWEENFTSIPCITKSQLKNYPSYFGKAHYIKDLPTITIPSNSSKEMRALVISSLEMNNYGQGFSPKDIVIGEEMSVENILKKEGEFLGFVVLEDEILFRNILVQEEKVMLRAFHPSVDDVEIEKDQILEVWKVIHAFYHKLPEIQSPFENKLSILENELKALKQKLK
ncbi:helix-turn-helix domain-containing protein [Aureivirga sp. CE67]|uniref:helix-turn-helix domain-containing protein n=1 Tax=Aureivirga sp. CE67 TaxID=1788983 RepID=UPI0018C9E1A6|nr:helix-turn-helix transcriptional regulator [Aureivirga sp. CE67]